MRKYIFTIVFMLLGLTTSFAQKVSVPEPEFADQTYLLTSDTEYQKLPREREFNKQVQIYLISS